MNFTNTSERTLSVDMTEQNKMLKSDLWETFSKIETDQKKQIPQPLRQKPYPATAKLVDLVPSEDFAVGQMPTIEAIRDRRSRRKYTGESLTAEELSYLLWATQGISRPFRRDPGALRTAPSAGARHPFETYLFINGVKDIASGLYRYLPLDHKLCFLYADPDLLGKVSDAFFRQYVINCAVAFIWTAVPYRTEWRYSIVSPKLIAIDVGHVCQNLYLAAESIGAGTCAIGAYDQGLTDDLLGVDGTDEFAVYLATVGKIV
jgi:SagB-type dehydrogenase family enzyme